MSGRRRRLRWAGPGRPGPSGGSDRAPDSAVAILGWRVWRIAMIGGLRPIAADAAEWEPGPNEARCHQPRTRHAAPGAGCLCGFNALHQPPLEYVGQSSFAVGAIAAWGQVDVYATGFRAQYACVLGLLAADPRDELAARKLLLARARYRVPVLGLEELRAYALQYASPVGEELLPGRRRPALPVGGRGGAPLPAGATPARFSGLGVVVGSHLAIDHRGSSMRLGATPSLAALTRGELEVLVQPGTPISAGDNLLVGWAGSSAVPLLSPVEGRVSAVNAVPEHDRGPAEGGWSVELRVLSDSLDNSSILWGRRGAEAYRRAVLAAGSDADLLLRCSPNPAPASALVDAEEARGWLRAFAQELNAAIVRSPEVAATLAALGSNVVFEVEGAEALVVGPPRAGHSRWASAVEPEVATELDPPLWIRLAPGELRRYWCGERGLDPDDLAEAASAAGPGAPLRLLRGTRGELFLARSVHERLFEASAAILRGLGNPWFRAGDAIADPVANLRALAGFDPPADSADAVA